MELSGNRVSIRSASELGRMRQAGRLVCEILDQLERQVAPGVTTGQLDALAAQLLVKHRARSAFLGYHGFPAVLCASVNDEVVHGIPSMRRVLREGDLLKLDFGLSFKGWFGDAARTVKVGAVSEEAQRLITVTTQALARAIAACRAGGRLGDLGHAIQSYVEGHGFSVVRDFTGHGIGRALHEFPEVPSFGQAGTGITLEPGMVIAIEPMINAGTEQLRLLEDKWTAVTADGRLSAHFEHTVVITETEPELLTGPS